MTQNEEQKKLWKEESKQLKKDLNNKKKVIKKREVEIKFPKKNPFKQSTTSNKQTTNQSQDNHLRNLINFTD